MSQAFFTSIAGIAAAQSKIDVVADNIANMNTVAFKSSNLTFQNVYSRMISAGTSPSTESGGTNPKQVGLGVTIGSITRNFTNGTIQSTGRSEDLNIQGNGFFTLEGGDGDILLSRAGNFSLDAEGNMVTPQGIKVLGTSSVYSQTGQAVPVRIPPALTLTETAKDLTGANGTLTDLNNASITTGKFEIEVTDSLGNVDTIGVDITGANTLADVASAINTAFNTYAGTDSSGASDTDLLTGDLLASVNADGTFSIDINALGDHDNNAATADDRSNSIASISFNSITSNFPHETGLTTASPTISPDTLTSPNMYTSKVLSYEVTIGEQGNINNSASKISYSIGIDGSVEASYSNGAKISVETEGDQKVLVYKNATGVIIKNSDINVQPAGVLEAANLQLQMASVVNEEGLISQGANVYTVGPNSGEAVFATGNNNGFGRIASGGLESSNVDLPSQFAEMILSQRAIDANSRTFSAMNEIMRRLVQLGR